MNEIDELRKKIIEVGEILKRLFFSRFGRARAIAAKIKENPSNRRFVMPALLILFVSGFFIGSFLSRGTITSSTNNDGVSLIRILFGAKINVPGKQSDGSFVFANFEAEKDLKAWSVLSAHIEISPQHPAQGNSSAKVTFFGGEVSASVYLEDYFTSRSGFANWSNHEALKFTIFNPRNIAERIIFQIKDQRGKRFKEDLFVPGGKAQEFVIPIQKIAASINIRRIDQLNFFLWEPKGDRDFFFDEIKLVPAGSLEQKQAQSLATAEPSSKRAVKMLSYDFPARRSAWEVQEPNGSPFVRVPFVAKNETLGRCVQCPIEGGIPFPMGELKSEQNVRVRNAAGEEVYAQFRVLAKWPDDSIKWLAAVVPTTLLPTQGAGYFLEYSASIQPKEFSSPLKVDETSDTINVNTGPLEVELSKKQFFLFKKVSLDRNANQLIDADEKLFENAPLLISFRNKEFRADRDNKTYKIEIEEKGKLRTVIKASGWFQAEDGERYCQVIIRYYFYAGKSDMKVAHTLIYTGYPQNTHNEKYKTLQLPTNETIQAFGIQIPIPHGEGPTEGVRVLVGQAQGIEDVTPSGKVSVAQLNFDHGVLNKDGLPPDPRILPSGWLDLSTEEQGLTVALRHFRENFPKAFSFDKAKGVLQIDLWAKEAGELDLSTTSNAYGPESVARGSAFGFAKTHDLLFYFHKGDAEAAQVADVANVFMEPLVTRTNPFWIDATGALGRLSPVDNEYFATEEKMLSRLFDWGARQPRDFKWYGMVNFGDTLTWWRNEDEQNDYGSYGWYPIGRWGWYGVEMLGQHTGALLQFARSGEWKYFEFGENMAKHVMDVDTVHYNTIANDARIKSLLDQKFSVVGSQHEHNGDHWGGPNEEASHTSIVGILLYYYLTGNERAWDVAKEIGEYFLTEPFTYGGHPDIAPHRAMANCLWGDVLMYQATGNMRYKNAADKIIEIYLKGQQSDGSFLEVYNPLDQSWSGDKHQLYMASYLLGALMSYHELTQDEEVKQMFLRLVNFLKADPTAMAGFAYAFFITSDPIYIAMIDRSLNELLANQKQASDSLYDGLIYDKPIYHRPTAFLYAVPYAFEALQISRPQRQS
jgi:hypothetical protein